MPTIRMRPVHLLLLGAAAALVVVLPVGHHLIARMQPEPVLLACPDVTPIPETRVMTLLESWPVPPEATPIPAPRRSVRRTKAPSLIANPVPVEQCAPDRLSSVPGSESGAALHEVPEPSSAALVAVALAGVGVLRRAKATT